MSNEELAIQKKNGNADQLPALFAQVEAFVNMKAEQAARKLPPSFGQTVDDLRQCGWLALYDAVEKFDPDRGAFLTALSFALKQQFASLCGVRSTRRDALSSAVSLDRPAFSDDPDGESLLTSVDDSTAQNGYAYHFPGGAYSLFTAALFLSRCLHRSMPEARLLERRRGCRSLIPPTTP